ncbi:MAG: metal ABC transporter substrate-binding protein [Gemmatimonadales bacterium]|jgi:ABC-type Zn uptake system ZnuABC Zn-binding protein ZnuA
MVVSKGRRRSWHSIRDAAICLLGITLLVAEPALAQRERHRQRRREGQQQLLVMTSLPTFAAIARELTGDLAAVEAIARGDEDPHFVQPRPSYAAKVGRADLFVTTGLDLEMWAPTVIDRANNPRVVEGGEGHVVTYPGVKLLEIPDDVSRAGGDVHAFGNPHVHTDPVNAIIIAENILRHLTQVDPANAETYETNFRDFKDRVMRRLFGERLVGMLGAEPIYQLARNYEFWDFACNQSFQGRPLTDYLGGWLAEAAPLRDRRMACYHKNWAYFNARFRIECAVFIEPRPGIPPTPKHLGEVVGTMRDERIAVLMAANYFSHTQVERVASRTDARAVIVPLDVQGAEDVDTYFDLVDLWVSSLSEAFLESEQDESRE